MRRLLFQVVLYSGRALKIAGMVPQTGGHLYKCPQSPWLVFDGQRHLSFAAAKHDRWKTETLGYKYAFPTIPT